MTDPEQPEEISAHDSPSGQEAAETAPAPVLDHEPAPPPPPPPPEKIVVRRGGTPLLLTLLITAALGGGLYWTWTHPSPLAIAAPAADTDVSAKLQALSDRIDKLEKAPLDKAALPPADTDTPAKLQALADRLDKVEKTPPADRGAPTPAAADATVELSKKFDDLTGQVSGLAAKQDQLADGLSKLQETAAQKAPDIATPQPDHAGQEIANAAAIQAQQQVADLGGKTSYALTQTKSSLESLEQRVGKLEQSEGRLQGASKDATLAVRLEAAQAALAAGKPLGDVPDAPPALQRFATTAPPTEAALRAQFAGTAAAILAASRPEEAHTTFLSRALARVEQSVTVRQGDHVIVGDPAAGVVARAQADLGSGDLAGAAGALEALSGRAADAAKSWREQAQALVAARAALLSLAAHG